MVSKKTWLLIGGGVAAVALGVAIASGAGGGGGGGGGTGYVVLSVGPNGQASFPDGTVVSGGQSSNPVAYSVGTTVKFTATPDSGYQMFGWVVNGTTQGTDTSCSVSVAQQTTYYVVVTFAAVPAPATYLLTINAGTGGTTTPPASAFNVTAGQSLPIFATPDYSTGYGFFSHWDLDGATSTTNPLVVIMDKNHTVTPYFSKTPPSTGNSYILYIGTPVNGTTNPVPGSYSEPANSTASVQAVAGVTAFFDHWMLDGARVDTLPLDIINVTMNADHSLMAVFTEETQVPARIVGYPSESGVDIKQGFTGYFAKQADGSGMWKMTAVTNCSSEGYFYNADGTPKWYDDPENYDISIFQWAVLDSNSQPIPNIELAIYVTPPDVPLGGQLFLAGQSGCDSKPLYIRTNADGVAAVAVSYRLLNKNPLSEQHFYRSWICDLVFTHSERLTDGQTYTGTEALCEASDLGVCTANVTDAANCPAGDYGSNKEWTPAAPSLHYVTAEWMPIGLKSLPRSATCLIGLHAPPWPEGFYFRGTGTGGGTVTLTITNPTVPPGVSITVQAMSGGVLLGGAGAYTVPAGASVTFTATITGTIPAGYTFEWEKIINANSNMPTASYSTNNPWTTTVDQDMTITAGAWITAL